MVPRASILMLIAFLCLLLAGCDSQTMEVSAAAPVERPLGSETVDLRNCDSDEDLTTNLAAEAPVRLHISIAEEAILAATGESMAIPAETQAALKAQIESVYQPEYEQAVARVEQVQLVVPGHKIHMYDIHWNREVYSSTASFSMEDEPCTAAYTYELDIPELVEFFEMSCTA